MKRPLAYITAAWCGDPDTDMELAARYCRMAYEAGFSPICPILYLPLFINDAIPEEHKNGIDMRRDMLRRSHVLVVCGDEVDEDVKNDIAVAKRLNITATTLDGTSPVLRTPSYIRRCSVLRLSFCFLLHLCFWDNTLYRNSRLISH